MNSINLYQYLNVLGRLWKNCDGNGVSKLLDLNDSHATNKNLFLENAEMMIERQMDPPLDEVISAHLKVLFYLNNGNDKTLNFHAI
jgi:nuclear mRNA export protein PCID2/THP1